MTELRIKDLTVEYARGDYIVRLNQMRGSPDAAGTLEAAKHIVARSARYRHTLSQFPSVARRSLFVQTARAGPGGSRCRPRRGSTSRA